MTTVAIVSGGLDSSVLAYHAKYIDPDTRLFTFNYGQRHVREIESAAEIARSLGTPHNVVDIRHITQYISNSVLTDPSRVMPHGHYEAENMAQTVVPNRNAIMLSIAYGYAINIGAERVAIAVHSGDHAIYPDCRPEFIEAFDRMEKLSAGRSNIALWAPFLDTTKADIAKVGFVLGVPMGATWSCYEGGTYHCGRCGTCVERKEAFRLAEVVDPTIYEDDDYEIAAFRGK